MRFYVNASPFVGNTLSTCNLLRVAFRALERHFSITLVPLWDHCKRMMHICASRALNLPKIHIFPMDFNDFVNPCGATLGIFRLHFGVSLHILKSIWAYEGDFGALWTRIATTLKLLWVNECPFSKTLLPNRLTYFYATLRFTSSHFEINF